MSATLSNCGRYRYRLWRGDEPRLAFVMLNPSTADAEQDDPTIRRCLGFARRERAPGIEVLNLYAFRATRPENLLVAEDPAGPDNARHLRELGERVGAYQTAPRRIVVAWGAIAAPNVASLAAAVLSAAGARLVCLGVNRDGSPKHPLYVPADAPLVPWSGP